ncbi:MAG: isoaspartyl peptidase/L-asparaginase [Desulfurococcaceae archaeon]
MVKAIILHGGAGAWRVRPGIEKSIESIRECTKRAYSRLMGTNNSLEAVLDGVVCMEDSGYLNAGYGSVPNILGDRELDAGLMTSNGLLGAVAAVRATRNPILLARIVAEKTPHVFIAGENADRLALLYGLPPLPPMPQHIYERYRDLLRKLANEDISDNYYQRIKTFIINNRQFNEIIARLVDVFDTVGAVSLDDNGVLAAATSTGGIILKLPGRIGDTPIPGAGFYSTENIACSSTGIGEYIIRTMPCLKLDQMYRDTGDIKVALEKLYEVVEKTVGPNTMGLIGIDKYGNIYYMYNTEAMLVGYVKRGEVIVELKPEPRINVIKGDE